MQVPTLLINDPQLLDLLQKLQQENQNLRRENARMNQVEADRLRFEQESRKAWNEVEELRKVNEQLKRENEKLKDRVAVLEDQMRKLNAVVGKLQVDRGALIARALVDDFELDLVAKICDDQGLPADSKELYLDQLDKDVADAYTTQHCKLHATVIAAVCRTVRSKGVPVAHPHPSSITLTDVEAAQNWAQQQLSAKQYHTFVEMLNWSNFAK
jgi:predicted RNase H-like nuclease (RuvC/YqgF family)